MFIGHFAAGFAAKRLAPDTPLGTLFLAAQLSDLLWPALLLIGYESVHINPATTDVNPLEFARYPYSHSLLMTCVWAGIFAAGYFMMTKGRKNALVLGALVASHWILDLIVHRPDLPLHPGDSLYVGMGLWNSLAGTLFVEGGLFAGGITLYARSTTARSTIGSVGLWAFVALLAALWMGNIFGPPPPNEKVVAWAGNATWLLVVAGYWIDRHRSPLTATTQPNPGKGKGIGT